MEFFWPGLLALLLIVPLLVAAYVWALRRRARYALRYSSLLLVKDALGKRPGLRRHIPPLFFLLGTTMMLVALARPYAVVTLPKQAATVVLAIDVSGSMRANDLKPSRLEAAKTAARTFISRQSPDTRIGVVSFSSTAALVQPPTTDHDAALAAINRLTLERRTAIGDGILASIDAIFEKPGTGLSTADNIEPPAPTPTPTRVPEGFHVPAIIILLTDGRSNTGMSPLDAAQTAADRGVRVFTIGAGTPEGATIGGRNGFRFRAELDERTLKQVAEITDAEYFSATDENALVNIYKNLNTEVIISTERMEITVGFTAGAMLLLLIGGMLSLFWFNRLP